MPDLFCDATTAAGTHCKNTAVGAVNGRNFCFVSAHHKQVAAMAPTSDPSVTVTPPVEAPSSSRKIGTSEAAWNRAHGIV